MIFKFLKYNFVQVLAYGVELGVFFGLLYLYPGWLVTSNVIAKASAGLFAFIVHKNYTFESKGKDRLKMEVLLYTLVLLGNAFLGSFLLVIFVTVVAEWMAKILSDVITVGVTFLLTHNYVFRHRDSQKNN